jgi:hypothetical protein
MTKPEFDKLTEEMKLIRNCRSTSTRWLQAIGADLQAHRPRIAAVMQLFRQRACKVFDFLFFHDQFAIAVTWN